MRTEQRAAEGPKYLESLELTDIDANRALEYNMPTCMLDCQLKTHPYGSALYHGSKDGVKR